MQQFITKVEFFFQVLTCFYITEKLCLLYKLRKLLHSLQVIVCRNVEFSKNSKKTISIISEFPFSYFSVMQPYHN